MMPLLVGADPELFLKEDGKFQSGYGVIPGTKQHPFPVEGGAVQVDGMAVEFNIEPAKDEVQFVRSVQKVMQELRALIPNKFDLEISPTAHFDPAIMDAQPDEAKALGCDPDYNAYTGNVNKKPDQHPVMRTAAGHVHLGWCQGRDKNSPDHMESCRLIVRQLDLYLGLPSVILDPDTERKQMYGQAGAFRPKSYGCEYRVMSNFWLKDEKLMRWVYRNTAKAFKKLAKGYIGWDLEDEALGNTVQRIINSNDVQGAKKLLADLGINYQV